VLVVLFRSRLTGAAGADYAALDAELMEAVREAPGIVAVKSFVAEDGERLTVVWWRDAETLRQWRRLPRHREAQRLGREHWYAEYTMEVAEVVRESRFRSAAAT
jgi:heme-degrading monooxygenase HmoA